MISVAAGTGEERGRNPPHHWFHLVKLEDGRLRRAELFLDRDHACAAAGL